ncbi:MAG TPA: acetolactate decarboxylase [Polyangiaceae bacterium]|nr:acetolactate decarboxylase [Polyangiaceae bacterium]
MAHTLRSYDDIPRPPLSSLRMVGAILLGLSVLAAIALGLVFSRPSKLPRSAAPVTIEGAAGPIRSYGSIPELLAGNAEAKLSLGALSLGPSTLAIGSISGLRGELAIVRGEPWLAYPVAGSGISVERNLETQESVAFLALTEVSKWQQQPLESVLPFERLASELEERARRAGIVTQHPFPVMIDGTFSSIELSVANGLVLDSKKASPTSLPSAVVKASLPQAKGTIVGFVAPRGDGRLMREGKTFDLQIVLPDAQKAGHLDSVQLEPGCVLRLPAPA